MNISIWKKAVNFKTFTFMFSRIFTASGLEQNHKPEAKVSKKAMKKKSGFVVSRLVLWSD